VFKIRIKPLSVNECWKGSRYKNDKYKRFETAVLYMLPKLKIPEGRLHLDLEFGFSSTLSDWDNPIKPFQDVLEKKYGFNDNRIKSANIEVKQVKKGKEFIKFKITEYKPKN